ncbi:ABC transporter permease [Oceanobacillus jeddahense]|uniref:ABC transporter permease n=1 Tax=Oceanobacillus jeddahense TaxID=1462527 RepID=A0ABY5JXJ5_9BACI|nr:ABC transporter permease [Oceanobacillus jeddahense]UUI04525.1 ABC transporter permease [Oceanobacillus jeddahense]
MDWTNGKPGKGRAAVRRCVCGAGFPMKYILNSEWNRLWKRKTTWVAFLSIPVLLLAAASYLNTQNAAVNPDLAQYTVAWNFPVLGLSEMLFTAFQGVILLLVSLSVTEEYQSGQLRMVLIRSFSFSQVMTAKYIVAIGAMFMYFILYFICSHIIGFVFFEKPDEYMRFYYSVPVSVAEGISYNVAFYGLAFLTMIVMITVFFLLAVISRTTTTALGAGVGFLLLSFTYPQILNFFQELINEGTYMRIFFTSIPMIQWEGLTLMLSENKEWLYWNLLILFMYMVPLISLLYFICRRKNAFI